MRERGMLWVVLAGMVAGLVGVAGVAVSGGSSPPPRLPALAVGGSSTGGADEAKVGAPGSMLMPIMPVEYRVAGDLPDLDEKAHAWRVGRSLSEDDVARLAEAVGLDRATLAHGEDGWTATAGDRQLRVESYAGLPWNLGPAPTCEEAVVASPEADGTPSPKPMPARDNSCDPSTAGGSGGAMSGSAGSGSVDPGYQVSVPQQPEPQQTDPAEQVAPCGSPCPPDARCAVAGCTVPDQPPSTVESCPMPDCPPGAACVQMCPPPSPMPVPEPEPQRPADLPSKAEAERIGRAFLERAGLGLDGATIRLDDGFSQWVVSADPAIGGLPTVGLTWSVAVGPKGRIEFASGFMAEAAKGDEYPLAGVQAAIERLKANPYGGLGGFGGGPEPMVARGAPTCEGCPSPQRQIRTITGVRLGLLFAPLFSSDGFPRDALLVPAYLFRTDEPGDPASEVPVVAVADEFLPKPPPQQPPGEPGDTVVVEKQ